MTTAILNKPRFSAATYGFAPGQTWTVGRDKTQMRPSSHVKRTITSNTSQMVYFSYVQADGTKGEGQTHVANFVTWIETHRASAKSPKRLSVVTIAPSTVEKKEDPALNTATVTAPATTVPLTGLAAKYDASHLAVGQTWTRTRQTNSGRIHKLAQLTRTITSIDGDSISFDYITAEGVKGKGTSYLPSFVAWEKDNKAVLGGNTIQATVAKASDVIETAKAAGTEAVTITPIPPAPRVLPVSTGTATVFLVNGVKVVAKTLVEAVTKFVSFNPETTALNVEPTDERIIV